MEFLFELLSELVLQILTEVLAELCFRGMVDTLKKPEHSGLSPVGYLIGYLTWGGLAGAISLWPFPALFIRSHDLRLINLIVTPFIAGGAMLLVGRFRTVREQELVRLDKFAYAVAFAIGMTLVRFYFAK